MNSLQKQYNAFIESECTRLGCKDVIKPLQEGFAAMCEAEFDEEAYRNGVQKYCRTCDRELEPGEEFKEGLCPDCYHLADRCKLCGGLYPNLTSGLCPDCASDDELWYEHQYEQDRENLDKCAGCGCDLEPGEADENGYCPDCSRYSDVCPSCGRKCPGLYPHLSDGFCQECERKTFGDGDPYAEEGIG